MDGSTRPCSKGLRRTASAVGPSRQCATCSGSESRDGVILKMCPCRQVRYCGKECQVKDRPQVPKATMMIRNCVCFAQHRKACLANRPRVDLLVQPTGITRNQSASVKTHECMDEDYQYLAIRDGDTARLLTGLCRMCAKNTFGASPTFFLATGKGRFAILDVYMKFISLDLRNDRGHNILENEARCGRAYVTDFLDLAEYLFTRDPHLVFETSVSDRACFSNQRWGDIKRTIAEAAGTLATNVDTVVPVRALRELVFQYLYRANGLFFRAGLQYRASARELEKWMWSEERVPRMTSLSTVHWGPMDRGLSVVHSPF